MDAHASTEGSAPQAAYAELASFAVWAAYAEIAPEVAALARVHGLDAWAPSE